MRLSWLKCLPIIVSIPLVHCAQKVPTSEALEDTATVSSAALVAMTKKCARCHGPDSKGFGGMDYITDLGKLVENGKVLRGTTAAHDASPVKVRILSSTNPMPPLAALSPADSMAIQSWILADSPLTGFEADAAKLALEKNCGSCHGMTTPGGGVAGINYISDLAKLVEKNKVKRGDEAIRKKSRIFLRITSAGNPMPPAVVQLTPEEKAAIVSWVDADAPL